MKRELTGRDVLFSLIAFFGVIIAVNVYYSLVAISTFRGEDDLKPYQEGVEYNQTLARRAAQERLGWRAVFDVARNNPQSVHIVVHLDQANGAPAGKASLSGEFRHPVDESRDRSFQLAEVKPGDYEADVAGITPGAWDVVVKSPEGAAPFEATRRMILP